MSDTTPLQRLHKRLSDSKQEPKTIVRAVTLVPVVWNKPITHGLSMHKFERNEIRTVAPNWIKHK